MTFYMPKDGAIFTVQHCKQQTVVKLLKSVNCLTTAIFVSTHFICYSKTATGPKAKFYKLLEQSFYHLTQPNNRNKALRLQFMSTMQ